MTQQERDKTVADAIRKGECPFGMLQPGQTIAHCPSGFPGCGCGDEMMLNPFLKDLLPTEVPPPRESEDSDDTWDEPWMDNATE